MIGTLHFGGRVIATLHDDGRWTSPQPFLEAILNSRFGPDGFADECFEHRKLHEAAAWYGADVEYALQAVQTPS